MQRQIPIPCTTAAAVPRALAALRFPYTVFKSLTDSGNVAFAAGDAQRAEALYRAAIDEAEGLLARAAENDGTAILFGPMAVNIAFHNLAALKARALAAAEARSLVIRPVARLIEVAASPVQPLALRLNCVRHLRHGLAALSEFIDPERSGGEIETLAGRASEVVETVIRTAVLMQAAERSDRVPTGRATYS